MTKTTSPKTGNKKQRKAKVTTKVTRTEKVKKKKLPCDLDADFLDRVKDAVVFLQRGPEPQTSIRSFVEDALIARLEMIRTKHAKLLKKSKGVIPQRNTAPRVGRPMS